MSNVPFPQSGAKTQIRNGRMEEWGSGSGRIHAGRRGHITEVSLQPKTQQQRCFQPIGRSAFPGQQLRCCQPIGLLGVPPTVRKTVFPGQRRRRGIITRSK